MSPAPSAAPTGAPSEVVVARMLTIFRGCRAHPALVETATCARYLLKFAGAGAGRRGLLSEFLASRIAVHLGLPMPAIRPVYLPPGFPWQVGNDEFDDMVQRSFGWNLGVAHLADVRVASPVELGRLPAEFLARLELADRLLQNVDRAVANPNVLLDAADTPWAIDFGACLYLERILGGTKFSFALPANQFLNVEPYSKRRATWLRADLPARATVRAWLDEAPDPWIDSVSRTRAQLAEGLIAYFASYAAWR